MPELFWSLRSYWYRKMAPVDNLTCVLHAKGDMRLEQTSVPEPKGGEVQVSIKSTGICGSDVHYLVHGAIGPFVVTEPMILGHETAGIVTKVGPEVTNVKVGDRVALEPGVNCAQCADCRSGRYNLCQKVIFCATPPYHGTLRRFYCHRADLCFKLPDSLSYDEGAFIEPLSVAVMACRRADLKFGEKVLVTGAGPIGLLNFLVAKAFGASTVVVTDIVESKLELVRSLGATGTVNVKGKTSEAISREILAITGSAPEVTLECSGVESSVGLAINVTRQGGRVVMVGMGPPQVKVPLVDAVIKELDIRGVFRYANCYPTAIELIASGKVDVKPLITHRFKLEEAAKAFETTRTGAGNAVKVIIDCSN
ncbi:sorbitol dehydrogenase [Galendromus occidentalis]|uniref:Sorbitol dehydrogenase n=1 Tax=Galendromus occidentalis TaxID=34638 RepID=A0AAJ6W0D1_9ACAR|nr:sorbitol dehydrogenase [Galendromus occidentalis]